MRSLQLLTPSRPCIFHCPFCIAQGHRHQNQFVNQYEKNYPLWANNLKTLLKKKMDLETVVITGTNEPLQDIACVEKMIAIVREVRPEIQIELQTRYYAPLPVMDRCDVVAYSIASYSLLSNISVRGKISRYVILLTDSFSNLSLVKILKQLPSSVTQVTLKCLHTSHGANLRMDRWILDHQLALEERKRLQREVEQYQGPLSIRFDENCMDAVDRYMVFREDGNLYADFDSTEKVEL